MDKKISRMFFNDRAEHWDDTVRNNDPTKLRKMANRLDIDADSLVLDIGTGTGVFIPYIDEKLTEGGKIIGMDYAINMLTKAASKNHSRNLIGLVCAEIETLRMEMRYFDVAVCYSTFPHFHDKPKALENIKNLLNPGGTLYICHTASKETINQIHKNIPDFQDHLIPEEDEMIQLLADAGFGKAAIEEDKDSYLAIAR
jgi:ubiquinone/menaquinone biosynthesis C-methylase UbiE